MVEILPSMRNLLSNLSSRTTELKRIPSDLRIIDLRPKPPKLMSLLINVDIECLFVVNGPKGDFILSGSRLVYMESNSVYLIQSESM